MGEKMREGQGVNLMRAETTLFIWSLNSKREEKGKRMTKEEADLGGVLGVKGGGSSQALVLVRGLKGGWGLLCLFVVSSSHSLVKGTNR